MNWRTTEMIYTVAGSEAAVYHDIVSNTQGTRTHTIWLDMKQEGMAGPGTPDYVTRDPQLRGRFLEIVAGLGTQVSNIDRKLGGAQTPSPEVAATILEQLQATTQPRAVLDRVVIDLPSEDEWNDQWDFNGYIVPDLLGVGIWPCSAQLNQNPDHLAGHFTGTQQPDRRQAVWLNTLLGRSPLTAPKAFWPLNDAEEVWKVMQTLQETRL